jgi:hypothetical protein
MVILFDAVPAGAAFAFSGLLRRMLVSKQLGTKGCGSASHVVGSFGFSQLRYP